MIDKKRKEMVERSVPDTGRAISCARAGCGELRHLAGPHHASEPRVGGSDFPDARRLGSDQRRMSGIGWGSLGDAEFEW